MSHLLVLTSVPAAVSNGGLFLDRKAIEGLSLYARLWDGPVTAIFRRHAGNFPFGALYDPRRLPFAVRLISAATKLDASDLDEYDIILCSGDNSSLLYVAEICRQRGKRLVFTIENIPETRRRIISLDSARSLQGKVWAVFCEVNHELRRRRAFRMADGIQANGYPAFAYYRDVHPNIMLYLDSRISEAMLATQAEMEAREKRLLSGMPLRLLHSGRLEPLKGSQDLIPIARQLVSRGVDFTLDIFGTGSLEKGIRDGITRHGLQSCVKLCGAVDFETELVPFARKHADVFLSCHRQSDPSCTYLENMGCGLAVIGYNNRMWSALCETSRAGWAAAMGDIEAISSAVVECSRNRHQLALSCRAARMFAQENCFEHEFRRRIDHLFRLCPSRA